MSNGKVSSLPLFVLHTAVSAARIVGARHSDTPRFLTLTLQPDEHSPETLEIEVSHAYLREVPGGRVPHESLERCFTYHETKAIGGFYVLMHHGVQRQEMWWTEEMVNDHLKKIGSVEKLSVAYSLPQSIVESFAKFSGFDAVKYINDLVGNELVIDPVGAHAPIGLEYVSPDDRRRLLTQRDFVLHELNELTENLELNNTALLGDDVQDLLFTSNGVGYLIGQDSDANNVHVNLSNMTKFDTTREDLEKTIVKYESKGLDILVVQKQCTFGDEEFTFFIVISAKDQADDRGHPAPKGKWLKSHKFVEPKYGM
jgi:hypothetical protein